MPRPRKDAPDLLKRPQALPKAKLNVAEALILESKGVSRAQIARMAGVDPSAVTRALQRFTAITEVAEVRTEAVDNLEAIFDQKMLEMLASVNPEKLEKAGLRDLTVSAGILFDKKRLLTGQATSHVAILASAVRESWDND